MDEDLVADVTGFRDSIRKCELSISGNAIFLIENLCNLELYSLLFIGIKSGRFQHIFTMVINNGFINFTRGEN